MRRIFLFTNIKSIYSENSPKYYYGYGKFVAGGDNSATSTDGETWTAVNSTFGTSWINAIAYGNGKFVVVADSGKMAYLSDN